MSTILRPIQEQKVFERTNHLRMNAEEHYTWSIINNYHSLLYTPPLQMGKSVQANLSRGLQSLTGYCQVGAAREVASAVVVVPDSASDAVGVGVGVTTGTDHTEPDSANGEMSTSISLSGSV